METRTDRAAPGAPALRTGPDCRRHHVAVAGCISSLAMGHGPILVPGGGTISVPALLCDSTGRYHPRKGDADRLAAAHTECTH